MSRKSKLKAPVVHSGAPVSPAGEIPGEADSRSLKSGNRSAGLNDRWLVLGVCIFLAAAIWVVFSQTLHHDFVNYDDDAYVYENPEVARGLTLQGIVWAFTHVYAANWHPLTWISHMLDCQFYGLNPGGHHLTNILLHTATAILLFLVLRRMTGFLWRSAFVAAVFAIHPLRVESVAWVAERKDVLSGLFFMLTLWAYTRYAQGVTSDKCQVTRSGSALSRATGLPAEALAKAGHPSRFYWLALVFFALGLMSKPMLVTLPFVLLLLDYWPLGRVTRDKWRVTSFRIPVPQLLGAAKRPATSKCNEDGSEDGSTFSHLLYEKLPLLGLAVASCAATLFAQTGALLSFEQISLPLRAGNAAISYVTYLGQMFWPSGLAVLYPFTAGGVGFAGVVLSLVVLAGISMGTFVLRRRRPYFITGWLWYLIMLVPVIGIVQVGAQARADRYTYLPQIGLYVLLTWTVADLCAGWRHRRMVLVGSSTAILVALICCAHTQASYWRNSETLWRDTLVKNPDCWVAYCNLGVALGDKGRFDEAIENYHKALQIDPNNFEAHYNLGNALADKSRFDDAIQNYHKALQSNPNSFQALNNLGNALFHQNRFDEAIENYRKAIQINPNFSDALDNLGVALAAKGRFDEAIENYYKALRINSNCPETYFHLGMTLAQLGRTREAVAQYRVALKLNPNLAGALNNLAWVLVAGPDDELRNGPEAVRLAERACELTHYGDPSLIDTLAAAYAQCGRFPEAVTAEEKAEQLATAAGLAAVAEKNRQMLELYRAGKPYHEPAPTRQ